MQKREPTTPQPQRNHLHEIQLNSWKETCLASTKTFTCVPTVSSLRVEGRKGSCGPNAMNLDHQWITANRLAVQTATAFWGANGTQAKVWRETTISRVKFKSRFSQERNCSKMRYKARCEACGDTKGPHERHHALNGSLIILCRPCHRKQHSKLTTAKWKETTTDSA